MRGNVTIDRPEHKAGLLSLLVSAHKHVQPVQACVVDDADGTGAVGRAQKPSQLNRSVKMLFDYRDIVLKLCPLTR